MRDFLQDLGYASRTLRRSWALTLVIVASLAIGIGANSAIFSVVNALLLKPLPYPEPDRLAVLWLRSPGINIPQDWPSPGQYLDIQQENRSFELMSISRGRVGTLMGPDQAERVESLETSSSLFPLLGAKAVHGRLLRADDDVPGQAPVVILSHAFWQRAFGGDPTIVGKTITLNGLGSGAGEARNQFEVVGVLERDFLMNGEIMPTVASIRQMDVFLALPFGPETQTKRRGDENFNVMARLKPGVTLEQARGDVLETAARIREKDKRDATFTIDTVSLVESVVGNVRLAVLVLLGFVALVLLIACVNVANLLLTRATGRQKEVAVRMALGASWKRLVRQLLTESLLLGLLGGAAGLLIAQAALQVVRTINPGNIPRLEAIALDGTVLAFTFAVAILTGLLFGLAPALRAARVDLSSSMKAGGRSTQGEGGLGSSRGRLRSLLVVAEVAISLVLLIGAGLLIRSFVRLQQVSPGFEPAGVVSMRVGGTAQQLPNRDEAIALLPADQRRARGCSWRSIARVRHRAAVYVIGRVGIDQRRRLDAAARTGAAGRPAQRDHRLLPDDEDSADAGPLLRRQRPADAGRAGGDHRSEVRRPVLARGRHRQAGLVQSETEDHDRRRRRHRQAVWPRHRRPNGRLPAEPVWGLARGEDLGRSGERRRGPGAKDPRARSHHHRQ